MSSGRAHSCFRACVCVTAFLHSNRVFPLLSPRLGWSRMRHEDTIPRTLRVRIAVTGLETSQTAETKDYGHPRHERDGLFWPGQPSSRRAVAHLQGGMAAVSARRHAYRAIDSWRRRRADADRTSPASHGGIVLAEPSQLGASRASRIASSSRAHPQLCAGETRASALHQTLTSSLDWTGSPSVGLTSFTSTPEHIDFHNFSLFTLTTSISAEHACMMSMLATRACTTPYLHMASHKDKLG